MSAETIVQATTKDALQSWQLDAEVSACFRGLYQRLLVGSEWEPPARIVGVTSCGRGNGVSTVATRLAIAAAESGDHQVLLIDGNSQASSLHHALAADRAAGFMDVVSGTHSLDQVLERSSLGNLWVLSLGTQIPRSPAIAVRELFRSLSLQFSFIVVDMSPIDCAGDPVGVRTAVDGVVLVVEAENTRLSHARAATEALSQVRLLGAVLNKQDEPR